MTPILEGLDGVQKMSKSLGNAIGIQEPAPEMYGKLMSISDDLMWRYFELLTDLKLSEIEAMQAAAREGALHPMQAKKDLARTITAGFHGEPEADRAAANWTLQFQQHRVSEDAPTAEIDPQAPDLREEHLVRLPRLLVLAGLSKSTSEAARKLIENAVSIDGAKTASKLVPFDKLGASPVLRLGKRSVRIIWT